MLFINGGTAIGLAATDSGPVVSGVAFTDVALDGGAFAPYTVPFYLSEGTHTVAYFSQDNSGNVEAVHLSTMAVDVMPHVLALAVSTPTYTNGSGQLFVNVQTSLAVQAADSAGIPKRIGVCRLQRRRWDTGAGGIVLHLDRAFGRTAPDCRASRSPRGECLFPDFHPGARPDAAAHTARNDWHCVCARQHDQPGRRKPSFG
jgi:hypothetical protein